MSDGRGGSAPGSLGERAYRAWRHWWSHSIERAPAVLRVKRWVRQRRGTEPRSRVELRCRLEARGGWSLCGAAVRRDDVVYSFGLGQDIRLERALATEFAAQVYAFDPTPASVEWVRAQSLPAGLHHVPLAVGGEDGELELFEPEVAEGSHSLVRRGGQTGRSVRVPVRRLPSIMEELGHTRIDHLKLDVEGAEYPVIEDMVASGIRVRQLLVEFHHRFAAIGPEETRRALETLRHAGYRIVQISPDGREYSFLGPDAVPGGA